VSDLRADLAEILDQAEWSWLEEHAKRGRVIVVAPNLDLIEVGVAIAEDNVKTVQQWMDDGWISYPTEEQISTWNQDKTQSFPSLIVQPFVLLKIETLA
jgi:hypothetical protein